MSALAPGTVIDGRYAVVSRIGSGGMADVYLAEDRHLGRKIALKVLHSRFAQDPEFVQRFQREASSAAGLQHKNVVNVFDRGEADGTYYIAMEFLSGRSLKDVIQAESPMAPVRAIALTQQILAAARFAHARGVVHRDIKPQNIIVDDEGNAKVTDFGIALRGVSDMTQAGTMLGTAQYISPEQAQGQEVGATSDLYSIGVVLFEMLTGRVPFGGDTAVAIALKHVSEPAPRASALAPGVPPALDAVVARALSKNPAERFTSADEFSRALEQASLGLMTGEQTVVHQVPVPPPAVVAPTVAAPLPVTDPELVEEIKRNRRWWWIALGLVAAVLIGLALFFLLKPQQVAVPYLVGRSADDARARLAEVGLKASVVSVQNSAPAGEVFRQSPERDIKVDEGSTVLLSVSSGPGMATVPSVKGLTEEKAKQALEGVGLRVNVEKEFSSKVDTGLAIRTLPKSGEQAERGSSVDLFVSKGAKQTAVPSVIGLERGAAKKKLEDAGFEVEIDEQDSDKPDGEVLEQSPSGGTQADDGSTVKLTVASGSNQVPDVTGLDERDASKKLEDAGFKVALNDAVVTEPDQVGVVQSQSPASGARPVGSTVTIDVGTAA